MLVLFHLTNDIQANISKFAVAEFSWVSCTGGDISIKM